MNNPEALQFVNQNIRPRAELLRGIKALLDADAQKWASLSANFPNTSEAVDDGREGEGVSRLTCADVVSFITVLNGLKTRFDQAGVAAIIDKPTVRPLRVE